MSTNPTTKRKTSKTNSTPSRATPRSKKPKEEVELQKLPIGDLLLEPSSQPKESDNIIELNKFFPFPLSPSIAEEDKSLLLVNVEKCPFVSDQLASISNADRSYFVMNDKCIVIYDDEKNIIKAFSYKNLILFYIDLNEFILFRTFENTRAIKHIFGIKKVAHIRHGHFPIGEEINNLINQYNCTRTKVKYEDKCVFSDTFDFPESSVSNGFTLKLRNYQLRTISWMKTIESQDDSIENTLTTKVKSDGIFQKIKIADTGYYLDIHNWKLTKSPLTVPINPVRLKCGILADDTGSGKTITCLALISSSPFDETKMIMRNKNIQTTYPYVIPSVASIILCPSNLHQQWVNEAKRCSPNMNIIGMKCKRDHDKYSWYDVMHSDIVVVSYEFLSNANYLKSLGQRIFKLNGNEKSYYGIYQKGSVDLEDIHFHRVFYDEFHELEYMNGHSKKRVTEIKGDFVWGITGTPKLNCFADFEEVANFFNIPKEKKDHLLNNSVVMIEFRQKFVKRNVPNLCLPPIIYETVWVKPTFGEKVFLDMMTSNNDIKTQIMMCCHYQIGDHITKAVGPAFIPLKDVRKKLLKDAENDFLREENLLSIEANQLQVKKTKLDQISGGVDEDKHSLYNEILFIENRINTLTLNLDRARKKMEYFESVFDVLENSSKKTCGICRDDIEKENLSILPCAHFYCYDCISGCLDVIQMKCPYCLYEIPNKKSILRLKPDIDGNDNLKVVGDETKEVDSSNYGSKLASLYQYVKKVLDESDDNRIILFLQYKTLSDFISKTLREINIDHVRVGGNVFQRTNSINTFKSCRECRIVLMSSEDSVSGINMTEATHVILLHPFWTGKGEEVDLAYEKQGISRAYRGGLDHPLKVIRFAVKGTIDEELTKRRSSFKL